MRQEGLLNIGESTGDAFGLILDNSRKDLILACRTRLGHFRSCSLFREPDPFFLE